MADVLGIIPLCQLIFKTHDATKKKMRILKDPDGVISRAREQFDLQNCLFDNQWKILMRFVVKDESLARNMRSDLAYKAWKNSTFDHQLRKVLGQNYDTVIALLQRIREASERIESWLGFLDVPDTNIKGVIKGSQATQMVKRLIRTLKVVFKADGFIDLLETLKEPVASLIKLTGQIIELEGKANKEDGPIASGDERKLPPTCAKRLLEYQKMQKALATFHDALTETWSCNRNNHRSHHFQIATEPSVRGGEIGLDLTFIYNRQEILRTQPTRIQLNVRSTNVSLLCSSNESLLENPDSVYKSTQHPAKRSRTGYLEQRPNRFGESKNTIHKTENSSEAPDLRMLKDLCLEFIRAGQRQCSSNKPLSPSALHCLGHIEVCAATTGHNYHHTIYSTPRVSHCALATCRQTTMRSMIDTIDHEFADPLAKLQIARCVAQAFLKFHSTPWLEPVWTLNDILMFIHDEENPASSSNTLHIDYDVARLRQPSSTRTNPTEADETDTETRINSDYYCNIKNWSLYSLGVALLEIDQWQNLDVNDIVAIRKRQDSISKGSSPPIDLIQRCLECNFGYECGTSLSSENLQEAVYGFVIGELDRLISLAEGWRLWD